ncbi:MAG: hypothetical protein GY796_11820 [Chloroflexi bacterium]|nr:hypothetical protein [Chloroflexota bacterium]
MPNPFYLAIPFAVMIIVSLSTSGIWHLEKGLAWLSEEISQRCQQPRQI